MMSLPKNRSNSVRKLKVRVPKRGSVLHYARRKKGKAHYDAITGAKLQAVNSTTTSAKSSRRPNRKFGGQLSSAVSSRILALASRVKEGKIELSAVDIRLLPYVKRLLGKKN
jgi:ribosomal protein L34E